MKTLASLWYFILAASAMSDRVFGGESQSGCANSTKLVCASDDITYASQCDFEAAKSKNPTLEIVAPGECCPAACPLIIDKVCSSTGETYTNACEFLRARCNSSARDPRIASRGPCHVDCSHFKCDDQEPDPVCGSDYKTYRNECALRRAQCESGSDENPWLTSNSSCVGGPPNNSRDSLEEPFDMPIFLPTEIDDDEDEITAMTTGFANSTCPGIVFQICGSDGISYGDVCEFVAARHQNETITFAKLGACMENETNVTDSSGSTQPQISTQSQSDPCDVACPSPDLYEPVCTSDGTIYQNECTYAIALCRNTTLSAASADNCDPLALPPCPTLGMA